MPPITTVASGFWTSVPVPAASVTGTNPSEGNKRGHGGNLRHA